MARATLTPVSASKSGVDITDDQMTAANADGHSIANGGATPFIVLNENAGAVQVTIQTPGLVDGDLAIADRTGSVPAGKRYRFGPYPSADYNQSDSTIWVDFDITASVKIIAISDE